MILQSGLWHKKTVGAKAPRWQRGPRDDCSWAPYIAPFLVAATTPSLTIILADLVTSLHPLGEGRSDAQILSCCLTFSISPINLADVLYCAKCTHHLITPSNDTGIIFLYGGTQATLN